MLGLKTFTSQHFYQEGCVPPEQKGNSKEDFKRQEARGCSDEAWDFLEEGERWPQSDSSAADGEGSWTTWTVISKTSISIRSLSLLEDRMLRRTGPDSYQQYLSWPCVMRVSPLRLCWGHTYHSQRLSAFPQEQEVDHLWAQKSKRQSSPLSLTRLLRHVQHSGLTPNSLMVLLASSPRKGLVTSWRSEVRPRPKPALLTSSWEPLPSGHCCSLPAWLLCACPVISRLGGSFVWVLLCDYDKQYYKEKQGINLVWKWGWLSPQEWRDEIHFSGCSDKDVLASFRSPNLKSCTGHCLVRTETRAGISSRTYNLFICKKGRRKVLRMPSGPWVSASSQKWDPEEPQEPLLVASTAWSTAWWVSFRSTATVGRIGAKGHNRTPHLLLSEQK